MDAPETMTYRELCRFADVEPVSGSAMKTQMNQLALLYDIEKTGRNQYIIHKIYSDEERQYIQDLKNYSQYLTNMLIDELLAADEVQVCYTYRELREKLGMVNQDYFPAKYAEDDHARYQDEWQRVSDAADEQAINYALKKLQDLSLINYHPTYKFYKRYDVENGVKVWTPPHILTPQEEAELLEAQRQGLDAAGLKEKKDLFTCTQEKKKIYYSYISKYVHSKGYDLYGRAVSITIINNMWKYAEASKQRFNEIQVDKYLHSKRFKLFPKSINVEFIEKLIKL